MPHIRPQPRYVERALYRVHSAQVHRQAQLATGMRVNDQPRRRIQLTRIEVAQSGCGLFANRDQSPPPTTGAPTAHPLRQVYALSEAG